MYKKMSSFILYCVINIFMYITIYFATIKPAIVTATSIEYNRMQVIFLLLLLILISMVYGLIMKKLIHYNTKSSHSIGSESILFTFRHILIFPILLLIVFFKTS
ncbi:hypothetical protein CDB3_21780 [Bacillus sp. CDB3]|nr:hypothetical protein [Bacillus sp. CDB3]OQR54880.1 hypothetical protein CDB3_21780 [Bacillus sp. CDB3]